MTTAFRGEETEDVFSILLAFKNFTFIKPLRVCSRSGTPCLRMFIHFIPVFIPDRISFHCGHVQNFARTASDSNLKKFKRD